MVLGFMMDHKWNAIFEVMRYNITSKFPMFISVFGSMSNVLLDKRVADQMSIYLAG